MRTFVSLALALALSQTPLAAQTAPGPRRALVSAAALFPTAAQPAPGAPAEPRSIARLGTVGVLTGTAAFFAGIFIGGHLENRFYPCDCDDPGIRSAMIGAVSLPSIAIPFAVHAANGGQGSLAATVGASLLAGAATALVGWQTGAADGAVLFIGTPLASVAAAVAAERATTRDR